MGPHNSIEEAVLLPHFMAHEPETQVQGGGIEGKEGHL